MSNTTEVTEHNRAYEQLVSGDDDLIGLIAYSLYKKDKRDFTIGWMEQHGGPPQAEHVRAFTTTVLTLGQQLRYRTAARDMIDAYAKTVSDAEKPLIEKGAVTERFEEAARKVEDSLRWYRQIPAGIVAGIVLAIVVVAVATGLGYAKFGRIANLERSTAAESGAGSTTSSTTTPQTTGPTPFN
jgi:hypothetical protein